MLNADFWPLHMPTQVSVPAYVHMCTCIHHMNCACRLICYQQKLSLASCVDAFILTYHSAFSFPYHDNVVVLSLVSCPHSSKKRKALERRNVCVWEGNLPSCSKSSNSVEAEDNGIGTKKIWAVQEKIYLLLIYCCLAFFILFWESDHYVLHHGVPGPLTSQWAWAVGWWQRRVEEMKRRKPNIFFIRFPLTESSKGNTALDRISAFSQASLLLDICAQCNDVLLWLV